LLHNLQARSSMLSCRCVCVLVSATIVTLASGLALARQNKPPKEPAGSQSIQSHYGTANLRHEQPVQAVALAPDGKFIASSARDFTIRIWDRNTGALVHSLIHPTNRLAYGAAEGSTPCLQYSADGRFLVAARGDGTLLVWETPQYKLIHKLSGSTGPVLALAIAPDNQTCASAAEDQAIHFWNLKTGKETRQITVSEHASSLCFSRAGHCLLAGCQDGSIRIWQLEPLNLVRNIEAHERAVRLVAAAPNGYDIASAGNDRQLRFWNTRFQSNPQVAPLVWNAISGFPQTVAANLFEALSFVALNRDAGKLTASGAPISGLRFLPDGSSLESDATGLTIWNASRHLPIRTIRAQSITALDLDRAGLVAATGDENGVIRLWDLSAGKELGIAPGPIWPPHQIAAAKPANEIYVAYQNGPVQAWGESAGSESSAVGNATGLPGVLAAGGRFAAVADAAGISIYELPDNKARVRVELRAGDRSVMALDSQGKQIACVAEDKSLSVLSTATRKAVWRREGLQTPPRSLQFSLDGRLLAGCAGNDTLVVWDGASGKEVHHLVESGADIVDWALSADGSLAATGHPDGIVRIWRVDSGRLLHLLDGHPGPVGAVAFSRDGRMLAAGSWLSMRLWEVESGKERLRIFDLPGACTAATFLSGGKSMLVGMSNTQVLRVSIVPPDLETRAVTAAELDGLWLDLESSDAGRAYRAITALASRPESAIALLRKRLQPVAVLSTAQQRQQDEAIEKLGNDQFTVRQEAARFLEQLGDAAEPALRRALTKSPSSEARAQLQNLLDKLSTDEKSQQRLRVLRACEVLERLATPGATQLLADLAKGAGGSWLTVTAEAALRRLESR
jgi:WD40 repeat protein